MKRIPQNIFPKLFFNNQNLARAEKKDFSKIKQFSEKFFYFSKSFFGIKLLRKSPKSPWFSRNLTGNKNDFSKIKPFFRNQAFKKVYLFSGITFQFPEIANKKNFDKMGFKKVFSINSFFPESILPGSKKKRKTLFSTPLYMGISGCV